jgi:hypothetical protein
VLIAFGAFPQEIIEQFVDPKTSSAVFEEHYHYMYSKSVTNIDGPSDKQHQRSIILCKLTVDDQSRMTVLNIPSIQASEQPVTKPVLKYVIPIERKWSVSFVVLSSPLAFHILSTLWEESVLEDDRMEFGTTDDRFVVYYETPMIEYNGIRYELENTDDRFDLLFIDDPASRTLRIETVQNILENKDYSVTNFPNLWREDVIKLYRKYVHSMKNASLAEVLSVYNMETENDRNALIDYVEFKGFNQILSSITNGRVSTLFDVPDTTYNFYFDNSDDDVLNNYFLDFLI